MRSLYRCLAALERDLLHRPEPEMFGSLGIHYTEAWPACEDESDADLYASDEHRPRCRKTVTLVRGPERLSIVLPGPYSPLD